MSEVAGLQNLRKREVRELVFEQLLMKISMGDWKPGDKIPSENELAATMGVSRLSVREAIQKLSAINLVETYRGKGTYVKTYSANSYLRSMTPMLIMSSEDMRAVIEYRRILDIGIVEILIKNSTSEDLEYLKKNIKKMSQYTSVKKLGKYKEYDVAFHMKLYEMTDNPFIIKISNIVKDIISSTISGTLSEQGALDGIKFHEQIVSCIETGDAEELKRITNNLYDEVEHCINEKEDIGFL